MKRIITIAALCLSVAVNAGQNTSRVEMAFVGMPDEYYLGLTKKMRNSMLESYWTEDTASATYAAAKNRFNGYSRIVELDRENDYLRVENSQSGNVQLKVLPLAGGQAQIALVFTACAPVCSAHIGFYGSNWLLLKKSPLPELTVSDFLDEEKIKADGKTMQAVAEQFDVFLIEYHFPNNAADLEVRLNSGSFMPEENYSRLKKYLKAERLLFKWDSGKYNISKLRQ